METRDPETLMRQAAYTSEHYFREAHKVLNSSGLPFTAADVVALAAVSAADFNSMSRILKS